MHLCLQNHPTSLLPLPWSKMALRSSRFLVALILLPWQWVEPRLEPPTTGPPCLASFGSGTSHGESFIWTVVIVAFHPHVYCVNYVTYIVVFVDCMLLAECRYSEQSQTPCNTHPKGSIFVLSSLSPPLLLTHHYHIISCCMCSGA